MVPVKLIDGRKMRRNFSAHADEYDRFTRVQKRVISDLCRRMDVLGPPAGPALDIGTGTGGLAEALCSELPQNSVTVMDIAHGMTCEARRRLTGISACDGDAGHLPFRDETFRTVVSSSVYQWVARLPIAFCEVHRVLQPGGMFAVALFGEQTLYELRSSHQQAVAVCQQHSPSHVQSFPSREEVCDALRAADLDCREIIAYPEVDYHASVAALLRELKQVGASNASGSRPRGLASRRVMQTMVSHYEDVYRQERGLPATYEVIIVLARKKGT